MSQIIVFTNLTLDDAKPAANGVLVATYRPVEARAE